MKTNTVNQFEDPVALAGMVADWIAWLRANPDKQKRHALGDTQGLRCCLGGLVCDVIGAASIDEKDGSAATSVHVNKELAKISDPGGETIGGITKRPDGSLDADVSWLPHGLVGRLNLRLPYADGGDPVAVTAKQLANWNDMGPTSSEVASLGLKKIDNTICAHRAMNFAQIAKVVEAARPSEEGQYAWQTTSWESSSPPSSS